MAWPSFLALVTFDGPASGAVPLSLAAGQDMLPLRGSPAQDANDLGSYATLIAVTDNVNQSKGAQDPAEWLPPRTAARCTYAIQWVQVKYRWRLSIDSAERSRLTSILSGSYGSRTVMVPPVVSAYSTPPVAYPAPAPRPEPPATSVYYENCTAVRAAGADPINSGDPGYSRKLDRDGDGVACE